MSEGLTLELYTAFGRFPSVNKNLPESIIQVWHGHTLDILHDPFCRYNRCVVRDQYDIIIRDSDSVKGRS